jgi:hypothetical protein
MAWPRSICGAAGDDPVIVINIALLTAQFGTIHQLPQFRHRFFPTCPALTLPRTCLIKLGGIDAM